MDNCYLVDNNALNVLRRRHLQSKFFKEYCRVTPDVVWEAREHPDVTLLERRSRSTTPAFLTHVTDVMATLEAGDTRLVDLYANKGAADPGLIAAVLEAADDASNQLFADRWTLVTNDQAVAEKARELGIPVIAPIELADLIEASRS